MAYDLDQTELYLFNTGTNAFAYKALGAHKTSGLDGAEDTRFAVWAPHAEKVSVVGDFNGWDVSAHPMNKLGSTGVWQRHIPGVPNGAVYKYAITARGGEVLYKADPFAFASELRPATASRVWDIDGYKWKDAAWQKKKAEYRPYNKPMCIYEMHLASWRGELNFREIADQLAPYIAKLGFTHVEIMPIAEYPFDESWGYQITGYYAVTARHGTPQDFMYFVDRLHKEGIGLILDWVPAHFPKDEQGLRQFDGQACFEHPDPRMGEQPDWGTMLFDYSKKEVVSFLMSNAMFWLEQYHIDGLRVDAVSCMLYLDYSKKPGQWIPNRFGGHENLDAIDFLRQTSAHIFERHPGAIFAAEESTAFPRITHPVDKDGLGFNFKWNMGWMHDMLEYMELDPYFRKWNHNKLTFSMFYAFSENYILSLSHDEVVHGKKSLLDKMPGDIDQKFASLRTMLMYMYAHPGKKLLFMGVELGEFIEWRWYEPLEWKLLEYERHQRQQNFIAALNAFYKYEKPLYEIDDSWAGFEWLNVDDSEHSCIAFARHAANDEGGKGNMLVCAYNFTPVERAPYRLGVPRAGNYEIVFSSDEQRFTGLAKKPKLSFASERVPWNGREESIELALPALSGLYLSWKPLTPAQNAKRALRDAQDEHAKARDALKAAQRSASRAPEDKELQKALRAAERELEKRAERLEKAKEKVKEKAKAKAKSTLNTNKEKEPAKTLRPALPQLPAEKERGNQE